MTYKELFAQLTPEQMEQQIAIFHGDEEDAHLDVSINISEEDEYFDHCDSYGNLAQVKEDNPDDWEDIIEDATICPKGTVTLHINLT